MLTVFFQVENRKFMASTMLEYTKVILKKVSFDPELFAKEFRKAVTHLLDHEIKELERWCIANFGAQYQFILNS